MPTLKVTFYDTGSTRLYSYSAPDGDWAIGDLAVVLTPASRFALVEIKEIDPATYPGNKPVVGVVSLAGYHEQVKAQHRKEEILSQLERAAKEQSVFERYRAVAQGNPDLAKLLDELEKLS